MPEDAARVLASSREPKELSAYARLLARSPRATDQEVVRRSLESEEFLGRLDSQEKYQGPPNKLRLREVLEELSKNSSPSAQGVLAALTRTEAFRDEPARADLLIQACASIRPAPPEVVKYWDEHWMPDDGFTHLTAQAVVENSSAPALALLEKKMADPAHEDDDKRVWMVTSIMMHRNDLTVLESCERMLRGGLPERLRPALVEAIFDYRPTEWFRPATVLVPPDRKLASAPARAELRKLGELALRSITLSASQHTAVEGVLRELREEK